MFWVNGLPLAVAEVKTPVRPAITWADGATDFLDDYWRTAGPVLRAQRALRRLRGQGAALRPGRRQPPLLVALARTEDRETPEPGLDDVMRSAHLLLAPHAVICDLLRAFHVFTHDGRRPQSQDPRPLPAGTRPPSRSETASSTPAFARA